MFDSIQTKLFNKGKAAYQYILQIVFMNSNKISADSKNYDVSALTMRCDIEIQRMLLYIADIKHQELTEDEQHFIRMLPENSDALKEMIPTYSRFLQDMTSANYAVVEPYTEKAAEDIPAALTIAIKLEETNPGTVHLVIKKFQMILNSFVAISPTRDTIQEKHVTFILKKFESYAREHGVELHQPEIATENSLAKEAGVDLEPKSDWSAKLDTIVGLDKVKSYIRELYKMKKADILRKQNGIHTDTTQSLNMVFAGNPGTGKTTMARLWAEMCQELGILEKGHLVEVSRADLVGGYVGQTAKKTKEVFESALGGVLFIDEAYSLAQGGENDFGLEAISTLTSLIDNHSGEIAVILAGYPREMHEMMNNVNPGLKSRFPFEVVFPDYTNPELYQIGAMMFSTRGFSLTEFAVTKFNSEIVARKRITLANGGNARLVRNLVEEVIRNQSVRIVDHACAPNELNVIIPEDVISINACTEQFDLEATLSEVVGLTSVKQYIRTLDAVLKIRKERQKAGLPVDQSQTLHAIFTGDPGTGKTMMARIFANLLYEIGYIGTNKFVEVSRVDLVAGYTGQTAIKTQDVIESAIGGVLFIDEAYALAQSNHHMDYFGKEAIDTLVKFMDEYRDKLVVILAGYTDEMKNFLEVNPGLRSRFTNIIHFPNYTPDELLEIAKLMYGKNAYVLSKEALSALLDVFTKAATKTNFGNGRFVRNVYEQSLNNQALRLSRSSDYCQDSLKTITAEDIYEIDLTTI